MTNNLYVLIITVFLIMCCFVYLRWQNDKEFDKWFTEVLKQGPSYGFTKERMSEFKQIEWWNYFLSDLSPKEALCQFLKDN